MGYRSSTDAQTLQKYRFTLLEEGKVKTLPSGATMKGTTQDYHYKSCGQPGLLLRHKYPCFCTWCMDDDAMNCPNASWCGKWGNVAVHVHSTSTTYDNTNTT